MATFLTPRQVADRWACSPRHVTRLCASGALRAMRSGDLWRISLADVEAYEAAHTAGATPLPSDATGKPEASRREQPSELSGPYVPIFAGSVPWRSEILEEAPAGARRSGSAHRKSASRG